MKKGFTLIELVVVLIIVAVLGTLGLTQYTRLIEKARGAEAKNILGSIRTVAAAFYMEKGDLTGATNIMLGVSGTGGAPGPASGAGATSDCGGSHYFWYTTSVAATTLTTTASRCTAGGKSPVGPGGTLTLISNFATGTDTWGGTGGY